MIAIIGAMKVEIDALLDRMSEVQACPVQKISFYTGKLAGEPVVVTQSGVGKTLAAMSTTLLLEHFDVDGVINIGTAGGLLENQEVLDVVISTRIAHHDVNVPGWNHGFGPDNQMCIRDRSGRRPAGRSGSGQRHTCRSRSDHWQNDRAVPRKPRTPQDRAAAMKIGDVYKRQTSFCAPRSPLPSTVKSAWTAMRNSADPAFFGVGRSRAAGPAGRLD